MTAVRIKNFRRHRARHSRQAFTLLESVVTVVILAAVVPVSVMFLDSRTNEKADALQYARANALAQGVMENVLADASSKNLALGYDKFASSSTYLNNSTTGLYARLDPMITTYANFGIRCDITIGAETAANGVVSGTASDNVFRNITVTASFTDSTSNTANVVLTTVVTDF